MRILTQDEIISFLSDPLFHRIGAVADRMGVECFLIGGYVRDMFLERPSKDIDVVVVGSGIAVAKALVDDLMAQSKSDNRSDAEQEGEAKPPKGKTQRPYLSVFKNFGTAQVKYRGHEIEFVGARKESYSHNSRKPIVEDGTLEDDLNRRDFTINAMGVCLNQRYFGELIDPFYGLEDLEDHILRTPLDPDITFSDDPLRMMRCVRFATQLNFHIDEETFDALCRNAERIKIISQERITDELQKIMAAPVPSIGFVELERCGLLPLIFPELAALNIRETRQGRSHKNIFYHTLEVLDNVARQSDNIWLRWAALLHDIGKPRTRQFDPVHGWTFHNHNFIGARMIPYIFRRMKLPVDDRMKYVQKLVDLHMRPIAISDDGVTDSAVRRLLFDAGDSIDDLMLLCEADITSRNERKKQQYLDNFQIVRHKMQDVEAKDHLRNFQPPVDGLEIMQTFNLPPCQEVGSIKSAIKNAIVEGRIPNDHAAAHAFMLQKAKEMGLKPVKPDSGSNDDRSA